MFEPGIEPPDELIAAAGRVLWIFGAIEADLKALLYAMTHRTSKEIHAGSPLVASTKMAKPLCRDIETLFKKIPLSDGDFSEARQMLERVEKGLALRNELIHGEWSPFGLHGPPERTIAVHVTHYPLERPAKKPKEATSRSWSVEDVHCLVRLGERLRRDLSETRSRLRTEYGINPVQWGSYQPIKISVCQQAEKVYSASG